MNFIFLLSFNELCCSPNTIETNLLRVFNRDEYKVIFSAIVGGIIKQKKNAILKFEKYKGQKCHFILIKFELFRDIAGGNRFSWYARSCAWLRTATEQKSLRHVCIEFEISEGREFLERLLLRR